MAQDFAKKTNKQAPVSVSGGGLSKFAWFCFGLGLGLFSAFLVYLWKVVPPDPEAMIDKPTADIISDKQIVEMDYAFYDLFPKAEVPVEEFDDAGTRVAAPENFAYLLQAGSFRSPKDADRLRAQLILTGMQAFTKKVEQQNGVWHRVMVGPFDSKLELTRAKLSLAEDNIASIPLRIKR